MENLISHHNQLNVIWPGVDAVSDDTSMTKGDSTRGMNPFFVMYGMLNSQRTDICVLKVISRNYSLKSR